MFASSAYPRTPSLTAVMGVSSGTYCRRGSSRNIARRFRPPEQPQPPTPKSRLPGEWTSIGKALTLRGQLLIDLVDYFLHPSGLHVATQLRLYASRMHSRSAHAAIPVTFVECDREEDIRRFRSAIGNERFIGRALKVGIVEVHVRVAMTGRRQIDEPPAIADKRRNAVDQDKVAQVIRAELRFEAVRSVAERCGHHSRICDDNVERFTLWPAVRRRRHARFSGWQDQVQLVRRFRHGSQRPFCTCSVAAFALFKSRAAPTT